MEPHTLPEAPDDQDADELVALWKRLTPLHRKYVVARQEGKNPRDAYKAAATNNTSKRALDSSPYITENHPAVSRYLYLIARNAIRTALVNKNSVIQGLLDAVDNAATATEQVLAWRELGKIVNAYEPPKLEVTMKVEELDRQKLATIPTRSLLEMANQNGEYILPSEKDPLAEEFSVVREALTPPKPIERDADG